MKSKSKGWQAKLTYKLGHCYIEWPTAVCYTELELRRIHRRFCHPRTDKRFALLKRANESTATTEVRKLLEKIRDSFKVCQTNGREPHRIGMSLPDDECTFNRHTSMDLMELSKRTVLHIVDRDTKFFASRLHVYRDYSSDLENSYGALSYYLHRLSRHYYRLPRPSVPERIVYQFSRYGRHRKTRRRCRES